MSSEFTVWRDYNKMKIGVQQEGREPRFFTPEEARAFVTEVEERMETLGIADDPATVTFHETLREYADELEAKRDE